MSVQIELKYVRKVSDKDKPISGEELSEAVKESMKRNDSLLRKLAKK
jgi:hypothetical protein